MTQYIDKSALVAEIESKKKYAQTLGDNAINSSMQQFYDGMKQSCVDLLSFLDTLEVKEMNIKKELSYEDYIKFFEEHPNFPDDWGFDEAWIFAKHFFELGLLLQTETNITFKYNIGESVREYKAQKGE